jgi:hypothetical protein
MFNLMEVSLVADQLARNMSAKPARFLPHAELSATGTGGNILGSLRRAAEGCIERLQDLLGTASRA